MRTRHYIIEGKHLGTSLIPPHFVHNQRVEAYGLAFFCPICARLWATCPVEGEPTSVISCPCERHAVGDRLGSWSHGYVDPWQTPGSIFLSYDREWNDCLPKGVLLRELTLLDNRKKETIS